MAITYNKWPYYIPNGHKNFECQDPPNFTQIVIFGLKMYHLAPLLTHALDVKPAVLLANPIFKRCFEERRRYASFISATTMPD
jgi:hypothetical protein